MTEGENTKRCIIYLIPHIPIGIRFANQEYVKLYKDLLLVPTVKNRLKSGEPKSTTREENLLNVLVDVLEQHITSAKQFAFNHDMSRYSVQRILKRAKYIKCI